MDSRNKLAKDRTLLANQRTFLAFVRTALMIFVSGVTFIKILNSDPVLVILGWVFLPVSIAVFVIGLVLSLRMKKNLTLFDKKASDKSTTEEKKVTVGSGSFHNQISSN